MPELTPDQVRAMAAALGVPVTAEDVAEVTHRLNGFVHALAPLAELPLDAEEPVPMWPELPELPVPPPPRPGSPGGAR
jgi:hypothetical protein